MGLNIDHRLHVTASIHRTKSLLSSMVVANNKLLTTFSTYSVRARN